jgi:hypothetical protein
MLDNKLCLTSVVEFLCRGRVDRGTGGGKVVVVVDSSKRKVLKSNGIQRRDFCVWDVLLCNDE